MPEDRRRCRNVQSAEVRGDGVEIERAVEARSGEQRPKLGSEAHVSGFGVDEERLYPEPVPNQHELPTLVVPYCDGEHPHESPDGWLNGPMLERGEDDFGIRVPAKVCTRSFELLTQLTMVVHLAIEDQGVSSAR